MTGLRDSINEIADHGFGSDQRTDVYLDPRSGGVYCFSGSEGDVPMDAWLGFDKLVMTVRTSAIPESVVAALLELEPLLQEILDSYVDSEFDGSNWRPIWKEGIEALAEKLEKSEPPKIADFLDPDSWFEDTIGDLKAKWALGLSAEQIIANVHLGDNIDGRVGRADATFWLEDKFSEWADELAECSV